MRTGQLRIALFVFGVVAAVPAWGSREWTEKLQMVSATPVVTQHNQHSLWAAPAFISLSEINFLAFDDKKDNKDDEDKGKKPPPPPPPPPKRSEKCPHGDDGGHDCRDDN